MTSYDVIVVGGGIVGAALSYELAATGRLRVLLCERGRVPGNGATARSGALIRQQHTAHPMVPLAVQGLRRFRDWERLTGGDAGFRRTGFAMVADARFASHLAKNVAAVNEAGGRARQIDATELAGLHPALRVPADAVIGYEPDAGYADPLLATASLCTAARVRGAVIAEGVAVEAVTTGDRGVTGVRTNLGDIAASRVVLCAGPGTARIIAPFTPVALLAPRRIGVARAEVGAAAHELPIGIDDLAGSYFRPLADGGLLFGVETTPGGITAAGEPEPVRLAEARMSAHRLAEHIPALDAAPLTGSRVGVDAYTPDRQPLIGPLGPDGLYLCTGFSGGGIKSAPEVGALVARELADGEPAAALAPFRPARVSAQQPIESDYPYEHS